MSQQHSTATSDPAGTGLPSAGDNMMWLDDRFRSRLRETGLGDFEAVMSTQNGVCLRVLTDRENWHLPSQLPGGAYLKKHHIRTWGTRLRAKLRAGLGLSAGRVEAENLRTLTEDGIPSFRLVAYGEKLHANGLLESFILTEELDGYVELQQLLRERFPTRTPHDGPLRDRELDRLLHQVAELVRRFHQAGYNHRDLYSYHVFIKETSPGTFDLRLIDLQRVQRRRRRRRRWVVKDLAQLAWSVPLDRIGCTQRVAFMKHYLGVGKLRPADKRLIRAVLSKQRAMRRRLGVAP